MIKPLNLITSVWGYEHTHKYFGYKTIAKMHRSINNCKKKNTEKRMNKMKRTERNTTQRELNEKKKTINPL